ncbi:MAG: tetratricopeptide repeat protein [Myxococcales bacterium]|nr:tetratricopeptide repeat protein [Myxococcales bacterium]
MDKELESYRSQLASNPDDAEALARLEAALLKAGDWDGLVALTAERVEGLEPDDAAGAWERLLLDLVEHGETLEDMGSASRLALVVGRVYDVRLGRTDEAMLSFQRAFQLDQSNVEALEAARASYETRGNWELVLQLYTLQAQATEQPDAQADVLLEMADLCLNRLDRPTDAVVCVRQALQLVPDHPGAAPYVELLSSAERDVLARVEELVRAAEATRDPRQRSALLVEAAELVFQVTPQDPRVETLLQQVLEVDPRNEAARALYEQFLEANARWADLVDYLVGRAEATARKGDRQAIYQRLALVAQTAMDDPAQAVKWHREVLKLNPVEHDSLNYCVDYYSEREQWLDLVEVYEAALRTRHRGGNESAMLVQIAMILWKKVEDLDAAENYFKRIKLNDPRNGLMLQFYSEFYKARQDWKRLLGVLASRQNNEPSSDAKIGIGLEMAQVAEHELGNLEKAIDIWKSILKFQGDHQIARDNLRRLFHGTGKWNALLEFLKEDLKLAADDDVDAQVAIYQQMIAIYRDQLNLPVMVINTYNQILQVDPTNAEALDALQQKYEASARWNDLIGILKRRVDAATERGDEDEVVALDRQIAQLWLEKFSNPNQAIEYLEGILELRPADDQAIGQLIEIYRHRKDWRALYGIYRRQLELLTGDARLDRMVEMARIAAKRLDEKEEAIDLWRQVVEARPGQAKGWEALENLYQKTERWDDLAGLYRERIAGLEPDARVEQLKKLGAVYAERLDDEARAADAWREVLALQPGELHAETYLRELYLRRADWDALSALYGDKGDWEGLVRLLGGVAADAADVTTRVELFRRMAQVCLVELDNETAAVECWERILEEDGDNLEAARTLAPYYARTERWDALVTVLEVVLRNDPEDPVAVMTELARVHEQHRDDVALAYGWNAQALHRAPDREGLLEEARRTAGASGQYTELAELLESMVEEVESAEVEVRLRRVLAEICAEELGRNEEAAVHYERVRALDGDSDAVLAALEKLYQKQGAWAQLRAIYDRQLDRADEPADQARILVDIGRLHETVLDDPGEAQAVYARLRDLDPSNLEALRGLQRLAERAEDTRALADYVAAELALVSAPGEIASLRFRLGQLAERQGDLEEALEAFAEVLSLDPEHIGAVKALENFLDGAYGARAAEILEPYMRAHEEWSSLRRVLELQVDGSGDPDFRAARLREVAELRERALSDPRGAFDTWRRLLAEARGDATVRAEIERLAAELAAWEEVAELYGRFAVGGDLSDEDVELSALYSRRLATLLEDRLARFADARATLEALLVEQGDDLATLEAVDRLTSRLEDWRGLVEVCERRIPLLEGPEARVETLFRVGDLWEEVLDEPENAVDVYRRVLGEQPGNERALAALERIFRNVGRWRDLADLLEDRLADAEGEARIPLAFQLGQVLETKLDAPGEAVERYADVVAQAPDHEPAIDALETLLMDDAEEARALRHRICDVLEPIYDARDDWQSGVHLLQVRLADARTDAERVDLHTRIARTYEERAADPVAAFASYGAAFAEDFGNREVLQQLERLAEALGSWPELAAVLRRGLDDPTRAGALEPTLRRAMTARVATLYEERVGDLHEAIAFNRRMVDEDEADVDALASLDRLYGRVDDVQALAEVLERRIDLTLDAPAQAALCFRLGALLEERLDQPERAIAVYRRVRLDIAPDDLRAHEALERLYGAAADWEALVEVVLDHAELVEDDADTIALLFRAARTYEDALDNPEAAVDVYRRVLAIDAEHRDALAQLDRLFGLLARPIDLLDVLEQERALARDDAERNAFEFRIGCLQRDALGELSRAVLAFEAVLSRDPQHAEARAALEGLLDAPEVRLEAARILVPLYEDDGAWARLRDTLRGTLEDLDDPTEQVETLERMATIEEAYLDDQAGAFASLAEAYRRGEAKAALEPELARLADTLGTLAELADLYAEVIPLAPERAVDLHVEVARLAETRLDDAERAIGELREVLLLEPDSRAALDGLERLYERTGDAESLVEVLDRKAELTEDTEARKALFRRMAGIQEDVLGDPSAAIDTWRRVLAEDEADLTALDALERLLGQTERWGEQASLFEHRLGIASTGAERADIEFRLARVCETRLADGQRALDLYRAALVEVPGHHGTREALAALFAEPARAESAGIDRLQVARILEPLYRADGDDAALVAVLDVRQAALLDDPLERCVLLREMAERREGALDDAEGAFDTRAQVLALMPEDAENRADLHRMAERTGRWDELALRLDEAAAGALDPDLKVALLLSLGRAHETRRHDDDAARDTYREVLSIEPGNRPATDALVELFSRTAAWEELVQLYLDQAEASLEPEEQKSLYFKVCQLLEDVIDDVDRAIATYRKVLEIEPDNAQAFQALEKFFVQQERFVDLAELLRDEIQYAEAPAERADLRHRLAEVLETRLDDLPAAVEAWRTTLTDDAPDHAASLEALERLLIELGDEQAEQRQRVAGILEPIYADAARWDDWVMVMEVALTYQEDRWQRLDILTRVAKTQEEKLGAADAAFAAYSRAFAEDYGNPDLQVELDRLAGQLGLWQGLVETYLTGIEDFQDLDAAVDILGKVARTFDARLNDAERAIECYRRVLAIDEANAEALNALERILAAEARHQDLVTVLSRKADLARDVLEKKELLYRICEIWEEVLDRPDQAIDTYRRIFEEDPEDQNAVEALIRLYERTAQWELLVEVLQEKLDAASDDDERKAILYRIARTYEEQLKDPDETILTYRSVLESNPTDRKALEALDRLYSREGRWGELIDLLEGERDAYEGEDAARADAIELRIADVLEHQLHQVEQAIERYGEILRRQPEHADARRALERLLGDEGHRLTAGRVLEPYYEAQGEPEALARVYELQLLDLDDPSERIDLLKRLAELRYGVLKHPRSAFESYARAFQEETTDPDVLQALHDLSDELTLHDRLADLYRDRVAQTLDAEVARDLNRRLARIYDGKLDDHRAAVESWQAVLNADPYDAEALEALDRRYTVAENWQALIEVLRRRIDLGGEEDGYDLRFRLGYLLEVVEGDVASAIDLYRSILWEKPDHTFSREAMERLAVHVEHRRAIAEVLDPIYRDAAQWDKLAILTEMRIELNEDPRERAMLWTQSAHLREQELNDTDAALLCMLRALDEMPTDEEVRSELVRIATERGAWAQLADAFAATLDRIDDLDLRLEDNLRIADWCRGRLRDPGRAAGHYLAALEIDEGNERALDALESLYEQAEDWASLADIQRRKANALFDLDEKRARLHRLAELSADKLEDPAAAVAAYEEILEIDEADAKALQALERLHERAEDWPALVGVLERRAETIYDGEALARIHRRLGELARDRLGDAGRAAEAFERVLDLEPDALDATEALITLYGQLSNWAAMQEVLVKKLAAVGDDERARRAVLFALGDNAESQLDRRDNAIEYFRQILASAPADREALDRLVHLYEATERWFDLVQVLRDHLEAVGEEIEPATRVRLLVRIAGVAEEHLMDADLAIETLDEVLEADPDHAGALNVQAKLYQRSGEWEKAAELLERAIEHAEDGPDRAVAWRNLGLLYLRQLDRPADARRALEAAVSESGDAQALEALLEMAREAGDDATVANLLERRLDQAKGEDRVALLSEIAKLRGRAGDAVGAVVALEEAHRIAPEDLTVADALLEAYFDAGRHDEAEPVLQSIIERLKTNRRFKDLFTYNFRMGCVAEERGDDEAALDYYTQCFEFDATYVPNLVRLGRLHFRREDWDRALKTFQTVLLHQMKLDREGRVDVFYHLGRVRHALGDERKAKDMFNRALALDADHAPSREALDAL